MNNYIKQEKYAKLMNNLNKSLRCEFYYEAIFIEYAILEDRFESLLKHAGLKTMDKDGKSLKLNKKLNVVNSNSVFSKDIYVKKHLTDQLIQCVHEWKNKRNSLIHDLINCNYEDDDVKNVALEGSELIRIISNKSTLINKYFDSKI